MAPDSTPARGTRNGGRMRRRVGAGAHAGPETRQDSNGPEAGSRHDVRRPPHSGAVGLRSSTTAAMCRATKSESLIRSPTVSQRRASSAAALSRR